MNCYYDTVKLGCVADVFSGYAFDSTEMNSNEGIPLIKIRNVNDKKVSTQCDSFLNIDSFKNKHEKYFLKSDDFLIAMTGQGSVGRIGKMRGIIGNSYLVNQRVGIIRTNIDLANPEYIYQCLARDEIEQIYFNLAMGSGQPNLSPKDIENLSIPFPPLSIQNKIATILSAYDDLIETNNQCIATLEQLAQQIYKEWFVRMRFPGWEHTQIHHGIPDGWEPILFGEIAKEVRRHIKLKDLKPDMIYVGLEHLPVKSIALQNWDSADSIHSDKLLFNKNDILFCKIRPYLHKVALAPFNGSCSSDTIVIKATDQRFLPYALQIVFCDTFIDYATVTSKGTKMPRADWGVLKKFPIFKPSDQLLESFNEISLPILEQINSLSEMNRLLTKTRNLLLPRLISGKLTLKQAEATIN